jgi:coenzyme F420-dependent glucose-6-phosphate dehydrogenase
MISYHASHEQFSPSDLLRYVCLAELVGFEGCHSSDHFHPWSKRQGHSGLTFAWLGAIMAVTKFPFSFINAPGQRYHPAIVAQGIATLLEMFPERLEVALGSGEAVNESITWTHWPNKQERNQRLLECAQVIKSLLRGETVSFSGMVQVREAKLYTLPRAVPKLMCAALSEETARWAGSWADGLLTTYHPLDKAKRIIDAFRQGGGEGKPMHVQIAFSYARDKDAALLGAHDQWRNNLIGFQDLADLTRVADFDERGDRVSIEEVASKMIISTDFDTYIPLIQECLDLGFSNIILHNVNRDQVQFIEDFGANVLPRFQSSQ